MESIRPMMSPILRLEVVISCMLCTACCTTWPPCVAEPKAEAESWLAICDDDAVCCTVEVSCDSEATVSCRLLAVCSVRADRSWLPEAISWLAVAILPLASRTWRTIAPRPFCISSSARCRSATSSRPSISARCDRSPCAIASALWRARSRGRQIDTMFNSVNGTTTAMASSTATTNIHWVWVATRCSCVTSSSTWAFSSFSSSAISLSASANSAMALAPMRLAMVAVS
ncbi:hypothetical protein D3C78_1210540 [compost metagenome]